MRYLPVGAAAAAAAGGYATLYRLGRTWGATVQERQQMLAGDELLPDARAWTTHAITIAAPAAAVWPWLVQMGWGRAGWYTYRWVDRLLFPANGPSADRLLPEHQGPGKGDRVPDGPPEVDCWFADFVMARSHLRGLRRRAQGSVSSASGTGGSHRPRAGSAA